MSDSLKKRVLSYRDIWKQLLIVSTTVLLFAAGGIYALCRRGERPSPRDLAVFAVLAAGWLANVFLYATARRGQRRPLPDRDRLRPLLLLLGAALVLRLPQLGPVPRNDSALYYNYFYNACRDFDLALGYWAYHFGLFNHTTHGPVSLAAVFEFFFPGNMNNIWCFQTLVSLGVVYCLYDLFTRELGEKTAFWGALLLSCTPMFLGLDSYFQPDFGSAAFLFYMMWAFYRKKYVLLVWFSLLLTFSKEFGIVLLVGFFVCVFLYSFVFAARGGFWQRLRTAACDARLVLLCLLCLCGGLSVLYYIFRKPWLGLSTDHFGLDTAYIFYKLAQCFCVNFGWLAAAVLLFCLIAGALRVYAGKGRRAAISPQLKLLAVGSTGAAVLYFIFSCVLITATLPRYNLVLEMLLFFWAFLAAAALRPHGRPARLLAAAAAVLLTVQAYWTVDPVMHAVYPQVETGGIPLVDLNIASPDVFGPPDWLGDFTIYNAQYRYLDKCIGSILAAEHYDESADILMVGAEHGLQIGGDREYYLWDTEKQTFTMEDGPSSLSLKPLALAEGDDTLRQRYEDGTLRPRAIIFLPPALQGDAAVEQEFENLLPEFYTDVQPGEASYLPAGRIRYYRATLLPPGSGE